MAFPASRSEDTRSTIESLVYALIRYICARAVVFNCTDVIVQSFKGRNESMVSRMKSLSTIKQVGCFK
jgi:hypothetical protein